MTRAELQALLARVAEGTLAPADALERLAQFPAESLDIATIDFNARGGDQYPYRGAPFTTLGVSYQQAVSNFIQDPTGLNGVISAADYPEGGEGRITRVTTP